MKAYKLEVLILDFDKLGEEGIVTELENAFYPNGCITLNVLKTEEYDIGEWDDNHPLNKRDTNKEAYLKNCAEIK